ncbi:hypothetical protein [Paradevosia shaoguanensis]|uniref:Uncharacterized protein n=1 Tax=Paradevosia shaoguanensis TaxID=1335043 RepID=A0AA41QJE4_9HYPH|nr:hypothetical protein [Paradevosia shaoguanensis]MCF1741464.1 hypothetical protein [Paradevosia shaoguanensis]MCI0125947.1 hypothetical protein [Paradevosia shaoguanensis]
MSKLTELVNKHIRKIEDGLYSDDELIKLYRNIDAQTSLLDEDRERLIAAIEPALRVRWPRTAKKLFGPKDIEAREQLSRIWNAATEGVDLSRNRHRNGVKTGGAMMRGDVHVDVYISFKNEASQAVHLSIVQFKPGDEFIATLSRYVVGGAMGEVRRVPASAVASLTSFFAEAVRELA